MFFKKFKAAIAAAFISLTLTGCANWSAFKASQEAKYVGGPLDALYDEYGVPVGIAPTSDGGRFVEFQSIRNSYLCTAKVTTNASGTVTKFDPGGQNGCIAGRS